MDTVIIKIYGPHKLQIMNKSWFLPELTKREYSQLSPTEKQSMRPYLRHFVFHPPHQEGYLPKVEIFETLTKGRDGVQYILKLEFSVPKLLYGNSLQEIVEGDKETVFLRLKSCLANVGITIEIRDISEARVSGVHFCKNELLPTTIRMQEILNELELVDISKVVDITRTKFKKGGGVLNVYWGVIEQCFYEKVSDALRPKNKRSDKGRIDYEREIIKRCNLQDCEVFRYEYRVKKTQTVMREINAVLGREPKTFVSFSDLFTPGLFKKMILKSWRGLIQRPENQLALIGSKDNLGLFLHILAQAKKLPKQHSMNRALISYGLARAIRDHGAKEVRRAIFSIWDTDHTERLTQKIEAAVELIRGLPYSNGIVFIDKAFERFAPMTLDILHSASNLPDIKNQPL